MGAGHGQHLPRRRRRGSRRAGARALGRSHPDRPGRSGGGPDHDGGQRYKEEHPDGVFLYQQLRALNPPLDLPNTYSIEDGAIPVADLARLDVPVLFLAGEEDGVIPIELTAAAQQRVGGSRIERVPEAGHSLYWEMPEVFNARVDAFLDEVLGG